MNNSQTRLYNILMGNPAVSSNGIGRISGSGGGSSENFFTKRFNSIENALGTTGAALVSAADNAAENRSIGSRLNDFKQNMKNIYKKYGYNSSDDYYDAKDKAENEIFGKYGFNSEDYWNKHAAIWSPNNSDSDEVKALEKTRQDVIDRMSKEDADKIRYFDNIQNELKGQSAANAAEQNKASKDWENYRKNSYVGKKINQDRGKFAGSAINTLSTMSDIMLPSAGVAFNAVQGGLEGVADELEQNGFENFDLGRAGQNALTGAVSGGVVGGLNKGLSGALAKRGGNLFKGGNSLTQGLNQLGSTKLGQAGATLATGATRGALSGAVGGATGAGLSAAMNGQDVLASALEGAKQGAQQGAIAGGVMSGANMVASKTPGVSNVMRQLNEAGDNWKKSGNNFDERLTNTLTSGNSGVGEWLQGNRQSKFFKSAGTLGNTIRDYTDQGIGIRKAEANAYEDLIKNYNEERGLQGAIEDARAAGYPNDTNFQKAQRYIEGGSMAITPEDAFNDLKSVYGDSFKESTYKNKDGSWKYKNGEPYVWTIYKNKLAMNLSKAMDAADTSNNNLSEVARRVSEQLGDNYTSDALRSLANGTLSQSQAASSMLQEANKLSMLKDGQQYADQIMQGLSDYAKANGTTLSDIVNTVREQSRIPMDAPSYSDKHQYDFELNDSLKGYLNQAPNTDKFERAYAQTRDSLKNLYPDQEITDKMVRDEIERLSFADLNESSEPSTAEAAKIARQFAQTPLRNQAPVAESKFEKAYRMTEDNLKSLYPDQDITDRMVRDEIERLYLADLNESSGISNAKAARLAKEFANTPLQNQTPDTTKGIIASDVSDEVKARLDYLRNELDNERISYGELAELQGYTPEILKLGDVQLAEAAGIPEDEFNAARNLQTMRGETQTPTTLGGWLKRAGRRITEDMNDHGVGLSIKNVSDETPETQVYRTLAGENQAKTSTATVAWDDLAREAGYNNYDELSQRFAQENPGKLANANNVLDWLDSKVPESQKSILQRAAQMQKDVKAETFRNRAAEDLLNQVGTAKAPAAKADNMVENVKSFIDEGLTKPEEWQLASDAITGQNGVMSRLHKNLMENAGAIDTFSGKGGKYGNDIADTIDYYIKSEGLVDADAKGVKNEIMAVIESLPSRREGSLAMADDATDVMSAIRELEAHRRNYVGENSKNYGTTTPYKEQKARVLKNVASMLENRIYDKVPDATKVVTPEAIQELKNIFPQNEKWARSVDEKFANIKTGKDLRAAQKRYVQTADYLANIKQNYGTYGQKVGDAYGNVLSQGLKRIPVVGGLLAEAANVPAANRVYAAINSARADKLEGKPIENALSGKIKSEGGPIQPTEVADTASTYNPDYNPQTRLYNAIGRTEGLANAEKARNANYLANTAREAEIVPSNLEDLAMTVPNTGAGSTSLYDMANGQTTQPTVNGNSYFPSTGDYWTDILGVAMSSAMDANDAKAFASLYDMYQSSLANLQKKSSSNSQQKLTATQQRANAAMNSLDRLSGMSPDLGYNLSSIPVIGDIATLGGNDYESEAQSLAQQIGYMVSGANIKEEEARNIGKAYVPQPWDSEATRRLKLQRAREIIQQYQNGTAEEA